MSSISSFGTGTYFGVSSGFFNSMFGTSQTSGTLSTLFDYGSIKNGSYYKLLKSYYNGNSKIGSIAGETTSNVASDSAKKNAASVRDSAKALQEDSLALLSKGKDSVFTKKNVRQDDGTVKSEYDTDAIYKAVSKFVKDYNSTIESAASSEDSSVLSSTASMVKATKANSNLLADVGISIGSDNKLTIDEKAFKSANMTDVKSIFNGTGSYAYGIASSSSNIYNKSVSQLANLNGYSYTSTGSYSSYQYTGSLYSQYK